MAEGRVPLSRSARCTESGRVSALTFVKKSLKFLVESSPCGWTCSPPIIGKLKTKSRDREIWWQAKQVIDSSCPDRISMRSFGKSAKVQPPVFRYLLLFFNMN